ncbi:MAG: FHIPEP family type III secretion protein [Deltaproteobacteria bacterium]|nr:FHIPEP family type III secretion protein [Deltaproteobacteria bacterium]
MRPVIARGWDSVLALFVVAIAVMLLIPLPTAVLDLLLAFNISFSLLLLLVGLYMPDALALLVFPSLLLLTTLLRLGLNVASTRLILLQADAGEVIRSFGEFLVGGEVAVGVVIFTIITLVNFIVIARGSSRVSEVAARFALDALPGKQMAIDSDLRSGLITPEEARRKRDDLRKESQLYGSMDGAMKFVQGDAIAGVFIILTNIIGGLYQGIKLGMPFSEAIRTYTVLTVGDGLVAQIPAILISICAGMIVTRVSSGEHATLSSDLGVQLFGNPVALFLSGIIVIVIALLPGLPAAPFLAVSVLFLGGAYVLWRRYSGTRVRHHESAAESVALIGFEGSQQLLAGDKAVQFALDERVLFRLFQNNAAYYRDWWHTLGSDFHTAVGLGLPPFGVVCDVRLPAACYSITVGDCCLDRGQVRLDSLLVELNPNQADMMSLIVLEAVKHPIDHSMVFWTEASTAARRIIDAAEIRCFDVVEYLFLRAAAELQRRPEEVLGITDVHTALKEIEKKYPGLISEAWNGDFINTSRLTEVLQELVREKVTIRDLRQVIESLASYCSNYGSSMVRENDFDLQDIVSYIRLERRRQIVGKLLSERGTLRAITLSDQVQAHLQKVSIDESGALALSPENFELIKSGLTEVLDVLQSKGAPPFSVLCASGIRRKVSTFLRACNVPVNLVTVEELEPTIALEPAGVWAI